LRHTKAKSRSNWAEADKDRPLDKRGRQQAQDLIPLLHAYGITRVVSSTSTRCTQTVQPFAEATELAVEGWSALSEEDAERNPQAVIELTSQLAEHAWQSDTPTLICAHRPVLPAMLKTIGIPEQSLPPGGSLIVHLGPAGAVVAVETHDPLA
jgi:8-oxo-(d)GTP phosphatase